MELRNVLEVISDGTGIQIFADCKSVFCGCMCEISKEEFNKCAGNYLERNVYRINYDKEKAVITLAV